MHDAWSDHPAAQDIRRAVRRSWYRGWSLFLGAAVGCLLLSWFVVPIFQVVLVLVAIMLTGYAANSWRKGPYSSSQILGWLDHSPTAIVWVYGIRHVRAPLGIYLWSVHLIRFVVREGKVVDLRIPSNRYLVVMKWLNRVLPHAEFGWTAERAEKWGRP